MKYIEKNLMPNEKIIFSAQINPAIFLPGAISFMSSAFSLFFYIMLHKNKGEPILQIIFLLSTIMFFILSIKLTIEATVIMLTTELAITNKRIVAKTGFIHRNTLEMLLSKVESVNVYQNIFGRLLDFGTVTITGTGGTRESFKAIIDPMNVRKKVNQIIEHYAQIRNNSIDTPKI